MQMTAHQQHASVQVNELLVRCGLASSARNSGFQCFLGSGSQRPYGTDEQELRVDLAAHRAVYAIVDSSSLPFLFTATEFNGEVDVTRLVLPERNRTIKKVRATKAFKQFMSNGMPAYLNDIEPLLIKLAEVVDVRLAELELNITSRNRIALLNLLWASSSNRIMHREQMDVGRGPLDWVRAAVDIEHILYAWSSDGWDYTLAMPALPLAEASQLSGVPLSRIRALYPQVTGRS